MTIDDAIRLVSQLIDFCNGEGELAEFEDDLYSLLDTLNEIKSRGK